MRYLYSILIVTLFGCISDSSKMSLSVINENGEFSEISKSVNKKELSGYLDSIKVSGFQKLSLTQPNQDNLIVEQKKEGGYLVLIKIRIEQFVIEDQPRTFKEVAKIMFRYLEHKDGIMQHTKFY